MKSVNGPLTKTRDAEDEHKEEKQRGWFRFILRCPCYSVFIPLSTE